MTEIADPDELRRRKAEQEAQAERLRTENEAKERRRAGFRDEYIRLLAEFLNRAEELGIRPERITPRMSGWSVGSIFWVEGYRTPVGIVTQPPAHYSVARKRPMRSKLVGKALEVEAVCLFSISNDSDQGVNEKIRGPMRAAEIRVFDGSLESDWRGILDDVREKLEQALLTLMA